MVGRTAELQQLEDALRDASSGRASLAFVAGDSGVGKTRLVSELLRRAEAAGAEVLSGEAVELGEGEVPYARAHVGALARSPATATPPSTRCIRATAPSSPGSSPGWPARRRRTTGPTLRRRAASSRRSSRCSTASAASAGGLRARGPPLGRPVHARVRRLPRTLALQRARARGHRPTASTSCTAATRCARCWRRSSATRRVHRITLVPLTPRRARRRARGHPRRAARRRAARPPLRAQRGQPAVHGGAARRRRRRPRRAADHAPRRADGPHRAAQRSGAGARCACSPSASRSTTRRSPTSAAWTAPRSSARCARRSRATSSSRRPTTATPSATRCCARSSPTTCSPASGPSFTARFAEALERRAAAGPAGAQLAAGIAHHYAATGDQRAALGASVRAADAAESVHAFGEAAALFERALELWDRVPDAAEVAGMDQVALLLRAGDAFIAARRPQPRRAPLLRAALEMVDEETEPRRAAALLERYAMAQYRAGRPSEAIETANRALALVKDGEPTFERATIYAWFAKIRMLQGRYREATAAAREAIAAAEVTANHAALLGRAQRHGHGARRAGRGRRGHGARCAGRSTSRASRTARASSRAPRRTSPTRCTSPAATARRWRSRAPRSTSRPAGAATARWLDITRVRAAARARRLGRRRARAARRQPPLHRQRARQRRAAPRRAAPRPRRPRGGRRAPRAPRRPGLRRRPSRSGTARYGALLAELRRRQGDLDGARAAVDDALDRIEFCTEDASRLARVSAAGVRSRPTAPSAGATSATTTRSRGRWATSRRSSCASRPPPR